MTDPAASDAYSNEFAALQGELRRAVGEAAARGWRIDDLEWSLQSVGKHEALLVTMLDEGVVAWQRRCGLTDERALALLRRVINLIGWHRQLPMVDDASANVDAAVLAKVRALLAKAESTPYPAEAEALSAKAHELMTRHCIDQAALQGDAALGAVSARRFRIQRPYEKARFILLSRVADACRCRALFHTKLGLATVFGFAADLEAVDVLYTSLLVQATSAMLSSSPRLARANSTAAYRRAFLTAFAYRIGERLEEGQRRAEDDAVSEHGAALVPVLANRRAAVDDAVEQLAGKTSKLRVSVSDGAGMAAGYAAADRATLATQTPMPTRPKGIPRAS